MIKGYDIAARAVAKLDDKSYQLTLLVRPVRVRTG